MSFSEEIKVHLKNMGWYKGRKDNSQIDYMNENNYPEFIKQFIIEYGNLEIKDYRERNEEVVDNVLSLNILKSEGINGVTGDYSEFFNRKLYPIGYFLPESYDVSIDERGYVYLIGEYCYCCGNEIFKGIENIIRMDSFNSLELDPNEENDEVWLEYENGKNKIVDIESYNFKYNY